MFIGVQFALKRQQCADKHALTLVRAEISHYARFKSPFVIEVRPASTTRAIADQ